MHLCLALHGHNGSSFHVRGRHCNTQNHTVQRLHGPFLELGMLGTALMFCCVSLGVCSISPTVYGTLPATASFAQPRQTCRLCKECSQGKRASSAAATKWHHSAPAAAAAAICSAHSFQRCPNRHRLEACRGAFWIPGAADLCAPGHADGPSRGAAAAATSVWRCSSR
jgi:hypothetical protein